MKSVSKNQVFIAWGVLLFAVLVIQVFNFIDDYHLEIEKHERINFLNAKKTADEIESLLSYTTKR